MQPAWHRAAESISYHELKVWEQSFLLTVYSSIESLCGSFVDVGPVRNAAMLTTSGRGSAVARNGYPTSFVSSFAVDTDGQ
jgi:hypothetical protein